MIAGSEALPEGTLPTPAMLGSLRSPGTDTVLRRCPHCAQLCGQNGKLNMHCPCLNGLAASGWR